VRFASERSLPSHLPLLALIVESKQKKAIAACFVPMGMCPFRLCIFGGTLLLMLIVLLFNFVRSRTEQQDKIKIILIPSSYKSLLLIDH